MKTVGVDVFVRTKELPVQERPKPLPERVGDFTLRVISNRGTKVWPGPKPEIYCIDVWRCRYVKGDWAEASQPEILELLRVITDLGIEWVHVEKLHEIGGTRGFSVVQGE